MTPARAIPHAIWSTSGVCDPTISPHMNNSNSTRYRSRLGAAILACSLTLCTGTAIAQHSSCEQSIGESMALAAKASYWLPDTSADPHLKNFQLPVYVDLPAGSLPCDPDQLTVQIVFHATRFFPRSVTRGTIIRNVVVDSNRVLEISLAGTEPISKGVLTRVIGDVLLGDIEIIPLWLRSVQCGNVPVADSIQEGYLRMRGDYCEEGSDRVLVYRSGFGIAKIVPNPSRGPVRIEVLGVEFAETTLELYSSYGDRVFSMRWHPANEAELHREVTLPADIAAGVYQVVLRSPGRHDVRSLVIAN